MSGALQAQQLSPPSHFAVRFLETYQRKVSHRLGYGKCRFQPTCSNYGLEAYRRYGFLKATAKMIWRLLRCNPWNRGSRLDPP